MERGEKWGMNIWLRERPRRKGLLGSGPTGVRVTPTWLEGEAAEAAAHGDAAAARGGAAGVRVTISARPPRGDDAPGVAPCELCGDRCGPIGLCLCRENYVV